MRNEWKHSLEQHAAITLSTIIKSVMPNNPMCSRFGRLTYVISVTV